MSDAGNIGNESLPENAGIIFLAGSELANTATIPDETIQELQQKIASGNGATRISAQQMLPEARAFYEQTLRAQQIKSPIPIYVYEVHPDSPNAAFLVNLKGKGLVYLVSESAHLWTDADLATSQTTAQFLAQNMLFTPSNDLEQRFLNNFNALAKSKGIEPLPRLVRSPDMDSEAAATMTREGDVFVSMKAGSYNAEELLAFLDHELGHIKKGDLSNSNLVKQHNSPRLSVEAEIAADEVVIQDGGAAALAAAFRKDYAKSMQNLGITSFEEFDSFMRRVDPMHPSPSLRLKYLDDAIVHSPTNSLPNVPQSWVRE